MPAVSRRDVIKLAPAALAPGLAGQAPARLLVSKKRGRYRTVQDAIDAVPRLNNRPWVVEIEPGVYFERVTIPRDKPFIRLVGQDPQKTVLTFNLSTATTADTPYTSSTYVFADNFEAENVTFENSYGTGSQAVAIFVGSDRAAFRRCRFLGFQDTLYVNGPGCHFVPQPLAETRANDCPAGRQFFDDCYIEGHVDFIFGNAAAYFRNCRIHSKGPGYVTAQSRTYPEQTSGFVFDHCRLTGENTGDGVYLGRPWRAYSLVVYQICTLGPHVRPEGWSEWRGNNNHQTSFYAEYESDGPGANPARRVSWSHQLDVEQAKQFEPRSLWKGNDGWWPL